MKPLPIFLLLMTLASILNAQTPETATGRTTDTITLKSPDSASMATIYVIRATGYVASAVNLRLVVDDVMMCKIKNNRYAVLMVQPGTHQFNATTWDKPGASEKMGLKMPVEAGKTYYMAMRIKQKLLGTEIFLDEITHNSAAPMLEKYKQDGCE